VKFNSEVRTAFGVIVENCVSASVRLLFAFSGILSAIGMLRQPMSLESGSEQWDNAGMKRVSLFFDRKKGIYRCSACDWVKDLRSDGARRKRDDKSMIRAVFIEFNSHRYVCPRVHTQSKTDPPPRKLVQS